MLSVVHLSSPLPSQSFPDFSFLWYLSFLEGAAGNSAQVPQTSLCPIPGKDFSISHKRPVDCETLILFALLPMFLFLWEISVFIFLLTSAHYKENQATTKLTLFFTKDWKSEIPKPRRGWGRKTAENTYTHLPSVARKMTEEISKQHCFHY